jgi:hypothetical protein
VIQLRVVLVAVDILPLDQARDALFYLAGLRTNTDQRTD